MTNKLLKYEVKSSSSGKCLHNFFYAEECSVLNQ